MICLIVELNDLSWSHKGEIKRVCEQDNIFALIIIETDFLESINVPRHAFEMRSRGLYSSLYLVVEGRESSSLLNGKEKRSASWGKGSCVLLEQHEFSE